MDYLSVKSTEKEESGKSRLWEEWGGGRGIFFSFPYASFCLPSRNSNSQRQKDGKNK
jgi:hypothetical protein